MKRIIIALAVIVSMAACKSSTKLLQEGQYDKAIEKSVKKLIKNPTKGKEINILKRAYNLANQRDNDQIEILKRSGRDEIWDDILENLEMMKYRQDVVMRVPQNVLNRIGFKEVDYNEAIATSKENAAAYLYNHATGLLNKGDIRSVRQAYYEFEKVKGYFPDYEDVDERLSESLAKGTYNVLFEMRNASRTAIPKDFEAELLNMTLKNLDQLWLNFDTYRRKDLFYEYSIVLNLKNIDVSPSAVKEKEYEETKEVEDGFQYVLDEKGNVKKDTNGMDIKVPKTKIIKCKVEETILDKSAVVRGTLDFYDNRSNQLIKTETVTFRSDFHHSWAKAYGDKNALSEKTKKKLKHSHKVPFPSDLEMIYDTNEDLKRVMKYIVARNRNMLINR